MMIVASGTAWLRRVVDIALIALIVVVLGGVALGKLVPLTGRATVVIGGGSMAPVIPLGSAVVIAPIDAASLASGDVVSLRIAADNTTFTHRIVDIVDRADGRWIRTKGDANAEPDPTLVPARAVLGRVELVLPLMGYLIVMLSQPVGVVFAIGLAATLLAIAWLLESLEVAPISARASARPSGLKRGGPARGSSGRGPSPVPAWFVAGEPMASRRTLVATGPVAFGLGETTTGAGLAGMLLPVVGPFSLQLVAIGTRTALQRDDTARPRPSAREQIDRRAALRSRRSRYRDAGRRGG